MRLHHLGAALSRSCLLPSYSALLLLPLPACGLPAACLRPCRANALKSANKLAPYS